MNNLCFAGDYACEMKDSDNCLQESPSWSKSYTCATSKGYCKRWSKDMMRCCPKTCENTKPFSEYECRVAKGKGTCTYPNEAQCLSKGKPESNSPLKLLVYIKQIALI